jgi:chromosome partitioning protein
MRKTAIANQKGGVAKTGTVLGLCSACSAKGLNILVVDLDPQANLTSGLGISLDDGRDAVTANDLLLQYREGTALDAVMESPWPGVDLIPATLDLANRDLDGANDVMFRLRAAFEGCDLSKYDAILFDCPPSVGRLMIGALIAADQVVYVTDATKDGLLGINNIQRSTTLVKKNLNPPLDVAKIVITKRENNNEQDFREDEIRDVYGPLVARTVIPKRAAWNDAHGMSKPIHTMAGNKGALTLSVAFTDLLDELPIIDNLPVGDPR